MDFDGFVYASIENPATVGVAMDYVDVYGGSTTRKEIMLAKSSGGFMVDLTANKTKDGYVDLWLLSVEPIGEEKFVLTSVLIGTYEDLLTPTMRFDSYEKEIITGILHLAVLMILFTAGCVC